MSGFSDMGEHESIFAFSSLVLERAAKAIESTWALAPEGMPVRESYPCMARNADCRARTAAASSVSSEWVSAQSMHPSVMLCP